MKGSSAVSNKYIYIWPHYVDFSIEVPSSTPLMEPGQFLFDDKNCRFVYAFAWPDSTTTTGTTTVKTGMEVAVFPWPEGKGNATVVTTTGPADPVKFSAMIPATAVVDNTKNLGGRPYLLGRVVIPRTQTTGTLMNTWDCAVVLLYHGVIANKAG